MKNIVRGNDFKLVIPVRRKAGEGLAPFPLAACEELHARLVSAVRRVELPCVIGGEEGDTLTARVEGTLPLGRYALEVCGRLLGDRWRSMEYEQIGVVESNGLGDAPDGGVEDGEPSVLVDTQIVVYADAPALTPCGAWERGRRYARGSLVSHAVACWCAVTATGTEPGQGNADWAVMVRAGDVMERVDAFLLEAGAAEEKRVAAEAGRAGAEDGRTEAEAARVAAEASRADAERGRVAADSGRGERVADALQEMGARTDAAVAAMEGRAADAVRTMEDSTADAVARADAAAERAASVRVAVDGGEIVITMDD